MKIGTLFTAAPFTRAKGRKQHKCPPVDKWMNRMPCVPTEKYYSATKRKEVLIVDEPQKRGAQ